MANCDSTRTFNEETMVRIRDALLIGLTAFGEIERLSNAQEVWARIGKKTKKDLRAVHPTGTSDVVSRFADALRAVD
ncbi:MAG: hypothetical protein LGR52_14445 [Candidatus Thiosymbion ectosymbiont of Robbea hypermnestra]|nr:hypothetical protein [Candidatus Thiosymbion ectosymbiont of Robbea hypermnestra]